MAARSYPSPSWSEDSHRPHFKPSYERHGYLWTYGALAHRKGRVLIETAEARNTETWLEFLDKLEGFVPEGEVYLIVDALPLHWTVDTMLWNWGHRRFHFVPVPKAAAWLNLIEGFWKILGQRSLARQGLPQYLRGGSRPPRGRGRLEQSSDSLSCGAGNQDPSDISSVPMCIEYEERRT